MGVGVKGLNVRCVRSAMLDRAAEPCYVLFPLIFGSRNTLLFSFCYVFPGFSFPPLCNWPLFVCPSDLPMYDS